MVTDSWERARERVAGFFRRRGAEQAAAELDESSERVQDASPDAAAVVTAEVEEDLRQRLLEVVLDYPDAATELAALLRDFVSDTRGVHLHGEVNPGPSFHGAHIHGGITFSVPPPLPVAAGRLVPHQVPPLTVDFINRTAALERLDAAFGGEGSRVGLGVIGGLSGVGKSTMASRYADRSNDRFPNGQVYVDFAGLDGAAATPVGDVLEALAMCLRAIGVSEEILPPTLAERTALWRSHTARSRILVVLDNVTDPGQVRPLVPRGPGSAVLVASSVRLGELAAVDGAQLISLEPLDTEAGLALLAGRCGEEVVAADRTAALRIVELCGGLPIALQVAAARLLMNRHLTLAALARELDDESSRLAGLALNRGQSVSAVFEPSYRLLDPDAARLYRALGLLPLSAFDAGVAAVALATGADQARRWLETLADASLVEAGADGRYRMHGLVRLHAREHAVREEGSGEEAALLGRVLRHYLALAALADRTIREDRLRIVDLRVLLRDVADPFAVEDGPAPLEWLDAERTNVLSVLRAAVRQGRFTPAWQLAEVFTVLFLHRRYVVAWRESLELGIQAAVAAAAEAASAAELDAAMAAEARLRSLLSRPLMDLDEHERARAELETAVVKAGTTSRLDLRGSVQEFLGRYWDHFDTARAIEAYECSIDLNERAHEWRGVAIARLFLGRAQEAAGDPARALATLERARRELMGCRDQRMAARATAAIGGVHARHGDVAEAMRILQEAVLALGAADAVHYKAQALVQLADIAERATEPTETAGQVRQWLTQALAIHEAVLSPIADTLKDRLERLEPDA
nr:MULTISPECIES: hypothetical protein [unclassified Streptomyces]